MLYAIIAVLVLILDQAVKYWATVNLVLNTDSVPLISGVISLVNIHNSGAAFGILQNARWLFVIIAALFVAVVIFALWKNIIRDPLGRWSAVLIMAGAIGNCIDRVMNGYVVDMFQLEFMNFAVFNVADIFITVCGILFCVYIIFTDEFKGKRPVEAGGPKRNPRNKARKIIGKKPIVSVNTPPAEPEAEDVRTYTPKSRVASQAEKPSPFSEWEALPILDTRQGHTQGAVAAATVDSTVAELRAPAPAKSSAPKQEFTLEDILAEFSTK